MTDMLTIAYPDFFREDNGYAALQFALNAVMHNRMLDMIGRLVDGDSLVDEIHGDPGWAIEYKKDRGVSGCTWASWPEGTMFRIVVHPEAYCLEYQECFVTAGQFFDCLNRLASVYGIDLSGHLPDKQC